MSQKEQVIKIEDAKEVQELIALARTLALTADMYMNDECDAFKLDQAITDVLKITGI